MAPLSAFLQRLSATAAPLTSVEISHHDFHLFYNATSATLLLLTHQTNLSSLELDGLELPPLALQRAAAAKAGGSKQQRQGRESLPAHQYDSPACCHRAN
jgi:hypothetical protein